MSSVMEWAGPRRWPRPAAQACTLTPGFHHVTLSFSFLRLDEGDDGASWEQPPADHPVLSQRRSPDRASVHAPLQIHRLQNSHGAAEK